MARNKSKDNPGEENNGLTFNDVADDSDINMNDDIDNAKKSNSLIGTAISEQQSKSDTSQFRGYYLENEVIEALERAINDKNRGKKKVKGTKSYVVNEILKHHLLEEGYYK